MGAETRVKLLSAVILYLEKTHWPVENDITLYQVHYATDFNMNSALVVIDSAVSKYMYYDVVPA
jgi:hypothetical protein